MYIVSKYSLSIAQHTDSVPTNTDVIQPRRTFMVSIPITSFTPYRVPRFRFTISACTYIDTGNNVYSIQEVHVARV